MVVVFFVFVLIVCGVINVLLNKIILIMGILFIIDCIFGGVFGVLCGILIVFVVFFFFDIFILVS